jgi:hypothetical protein
MTELSASSRPTNSLFSLQNESSALAAFRASDLIIVSSFDIRASSFTSSRKKENAREHRVHD